MSEGFGEPGEVLDDDPAPLTPGPAQASARWDIHIEQVTGPDDAEDLIRELLDEWTLPGAGSNPIRGALSVWWGPPSTDPTVERPLRTDLHHPTGYARLLWRGDQIGHEFGIDPLPEPVAVLASSEQPPIIVPAFQAQASLDGAIRAVREYVENGHRPDTRLIWTSQ